MKVTYIGHSGFLVETDIAYFLFDYYKGVIPEMKHDKPLLVFVSHIHGDHYNPVIFTLADKYPSVHYYISNDIQLSEKVIEDFNLTEDYIEQRITIIPPGLKRIVQLGHDENGKNFIVIETIKSTDQGLAYLITVGDKRIYHAGDLNSWVWEGDTKQQFNNMSALFKRAMEKIDGRDIYLAFAPLDPRQGQYYKLGMDYLLNAAPITYAVPMHMWNEFEIVDQYEKERLTKDLPTKIIKMSPEHPVIEL